jgi:hypothetical protein
MRRIFIGSSVEGEAHAQEVSKLLKMKDTEPVLWREVFEPGYVTFEALENMMRDCCGAVFIATPDDDGHIRGRAVKTPRANIMLEFGLVAGRLGRTNVAICQYGCAELPSDLKGLTMIPMDPPPDISADAQVEFRLATDEQVRKWASRLIGTAEMIARTEIVHGYAGRWGFTVDLTRWRGLQIASPSYVEVNGDFDLFVGPNGQSGSGFAHGRLTFKLTDSQRGDCQPYQGEYRISHEITNVLCGGDGALSFTSTVFALHWMIAPSLLPPELAGLTDPPEPWPFSWEFHPTGQPRALEGSLRAEAGGIITLGTAEAIRRPQESSF